MKLLCVRCDAVIVEFGTDDKAWIAGYCRECAENC